MTTYDEAVSWVSALPARTGLFSDFDGTLSPIVRRPEVAEPLPRAAEALRRLGGRLAVVGVVSGRPAAWLLDRLGGDLAAAGVELYGIHGVEHVIDGSVEVAAGAGAWEGIVAAARQEAEEAAVPGLHVEDKRYSVTLHWRDAPDPAAVSRTAEALAASLAARNGLLARPGKASVELLAPIGVDKGSIVAQWAGRDDLRRLAFLGDDTSDVAAFVSLDELAASGRATGLKIAVASGDSPAELLERADLVLASPAEAVQLLSDVADRLEEAAAAT